MVGLLSLSNVIFAADKDDGVLRYKIPVVAGAERFTDILESPTFLALALQNVGVKIVGNAEIKIKDPKTFDVNGIEVKFIKKDGSLFVYQAKLDVSILSGKAPPSLTMVIDVSGLHKNIVDVSVSSSLVKFLSENIREIIRTKIQKISGEHNQKRVLDYLHKLSGSQHEGIQGILGEIVMDAYNVHINGGAQRSGSSSTQCQMRDYSLSAYLLIALLIILAIYFIKKRSRSKV